MYLNKVLLIGRATQDPEIRVLPDGRKVAVFSLATNRVFFTKEGEKKEETEFHNIVAFGKWAEVCQNYLKKGNLLFVEGRLQTRSWEGQDGQKKQRTEIIVERLNLGPKEKKETLKKTPETKEVKKEEIKKEIPVIEEDEINLDDLPL